ncbi:BREX system ATP-binding domain-containing protein [Saccharopolyspora rosea]|uniref:BREX system ATP-binding domain-containing protein n=1 Tax=Saccharopolyspora rosea TaxID=524884 RepID=A0ABW3FW25_9PSEU|nr:BREX system ATP-binding domain-containing protein [Saccharopolyspora rosea]
MRVKPTTSDGTPALEVDEYVKHVRNEYLHAYVHGGGASVKFVAGDEDTTTSYFSKRLENAACDGGYLHVRLDAAQTRVQFVEELFFAVSRNVDWVRLAADFLHRVYAGLDIPPDPGQPPEVSVQVRRVAEANGLHHGELYRTVRRRLERELLGENLLMHQFRVAMLRLCESLLDWVDTDADEHNIVLRWLRGHSVPVAELRTVGLHARVARHQARYMFNSLSRWVHMTGAPGIVVELDVGRVAVGRRPPAAARRGFYYTKAAALDTFEILRQFVDGTDDLLAFLLVVTMPQRMVVDTVRGLPAYHALYLRVANEVYDAERVNPFGSLVHVTRNPRE